MNNLIPFIIIMIVLAIFLIVLPLIKAIKIINFKINKNNYTTIKANLIKEEKIVRRKNLVNYYMYRGLYSFTDNENNTHEFYGPYSYNKVENEMETYYINNGSFKYYNKQYIKSFGSTILILFFGILIILLMICALFLQ